MVVGHGGCMSMGMGNLHVVGTLGHGHMVAWVHGCMELIFK